MIIKIILAICLFCVLFKIGRVLFKIASMILGIVGVLALATMIFSSIF